jgi:hypothetical protein
VDKKIDKMAAGALEGRRMMDEGKDEKDLS